MASVSQSRRRKVTCAICNYAFEADGPEQARVFLNSHLYIEHEWTPGMCEDLVWGTYGQLLRCGVHIATIEVVD